MKELWPGWETVEAIGSGGFSKVYKIRKQDSGDERDYYSALKIISIPQSPDEYDTYLDEGYDEDTITGIFTSQIKRIVDEFHLMSQFKGNSNIVSYEDHMIVPRQDGKGWDILIRMELLTSLTKHTAKNALSTEETVKLGIGICRALELCQKQNIIHRDIKPQNIFVNRFGDYKLGDFGIAKSMDHTTHATKTGTYSYMAPEVYRGEAYGATIDLYSLGLVLYWLLNERRMPFLPLPPTAPTATQLSEAQVRRLAGEALPAPKNGSERLKAIVLKACAANAADRYADATAMRKELERELFAIMDAAETEGTAAVVVPLAETAADDATALSEPEEKTESLIFAAPPAPAPTPAEASVEADERTEAMPFAAFAGGEEADEAPDSEATVGLFGAGGATVGLFGEKTEPAPAKAAEPAPTEPAPAPASTPAPTPASPVQPKQSGAGKWIAIIGGAVVVLIVVLLLLLRGCGGEEGTTTTQDGGNAILPGITTQDEYGSTTAPPVTNPPDTTPALTPSEGLAFTQNDDGTYTVSGIGDCKDTDLVIPATYKGKAVTAIGANAFVECAQIKSVSIPDGIKTIGVLAFGKCNGLTDVTISATATEMHWQAFAYCSGIQRITVDPQNKAFKSIDGNLYTKDGKTLIQYATGKTASTFAIPAGVTEIGSSAFASCANLTGVTIPDSVTTIQPFAFYECKKLKSIKIPNSVTNIVNSMDFFAGCISLTSVTLPKSITAIGMGMFRNCTSLQSITIPAAVNWIGENAFSGCDQLNSITMENPNRWCYGSDSEEWKSVSIPGNSPTTTASIIKQYASYRWVHASEGLEYTLIPNHYGIDVYSVSGIGTCTDADVIIPSRYKGGIVSSIGHSAFLGCTGLTSITIPDSVTEIGDRAFFDCTGLTSITIPDSVTEIGVNAFFDCTGLTSITIPDSMTEIGGAAFSGCTGLTSITIPDSVTEIGGYAFSGCTGLTSITIPDSVTEIGAGAFYGCTGLTSITIPNNVTMIGEHAFYGCTGLTSITISDSVTAIGERAFFYCTGLTSVTFENPNGWYAGDTKLSGLNNPATVAEYLTRDYVDQSWMCSKYSKGLAYTQNDGGTYTVSGIGTCTDTDIVIPATYNGKAVTAIGHSAFYKCTGLTSITISDSVTEIGDGAFFGCTNLTSIKIPDSVTEIGDTAFYDCTGLTSITIPDSVTVIGGYAFSYCTGLTSITIPNSVTEIGGSAFYRCTGLTSVTFENPNGWYAGDEETETKLSGLNNPTTAAQYLTDTYEAYNWNRY